MPVGVSDTSLLSGIDNPEIGNLQEARTMLAEQVKDWKRQWQDEARKEGEKEGWKAGEKKGQKKGESTILIKQLTHKFGTIDARTRRRIADASSKQLLNWAERVLTADRIEDVFG